MARKPDEGDGQKISKAFAYRDASATLGEDADLDKVHQYILDKFNIDMKKTQISQYRSNEKKKTGKRGKRGRKPKHAGAEAAAVNAAPKTPARGDAVIEFVGAVRGWENKLGAEKICEVIQALYQRK